MKIWAQFMTLMGFLLNILEVFFPRLENSESKMVFNVFYFNVISYQFHINFCEFHDNLSHFFYYKERFVKWKVSIYVKGSSLNH